MSPKYALPCPCGAVVPVESRHAGGTVPCPACDQSLDVPKLRDLQRLDQIADETTERVQSGWSGTQGALFAAGLASMMIAAGAALYTYQYKAFYDTYTTPVEQQVNSEEIQGASLLDSWKRWNEFKKVRLASRPKPTHLLALERASTMQKWLAFYGGLASLGAISIALSFIVRTRPPH